MIRFILDGEVIEVTNPDPTGTVLDLLRYTLRRTGTKEGCAEGDCGACTVVLGELDGEDSVKWRAVNACILFLPMIDGKALKTVESLGGEHPVQREMVERHFRYTGSYRAREILGDWEASRGKFVKIMPTDYRRALGEMWRAANPQQMAA